MRKAGRLLLALLAALSVSCAQQQGRTTGNGDAIGIDVSHHNGTIDWKAVASDTAGVSFVYVKATEGTTVRDSMYLRNITGARSAGLKAGAYHYFRMTSSAHDQFRNFSKALDSAPFDLIPMVDVETCDRATVEQTRDSLMILLGLLEERYGVAPMIYGTNRSYNTICGDAFGTRYPLYIGRYGSRAPELKGTARYAVWQYSERGRIDGVGKPVDLCRFNPRRSVSEIAMPERRPSYVSIESCGDLTVYTPDFTRIDLVTGTMPSKDEKDVIFVCEAAFTGELLDEFIHSNIAGNHVSGGRYYRGYRCGPNNGVFTWSEEDGWQFCRCGHDESVTPLKKAASHGGMGFCQNLLFHEGERIGGCFKETSVNQYRALCELDGRLCIVDCAMDIPFGTFLDELKTLGVKEAIYCDMGTGWNYSWYREADGSVKEIFTSRIPYTTNWITFYKE